MAVRFQGRGGYNNGSACNDNYVTGSGQVKTLWRGAGTKVPIGAEITPGKRHDIL